MEFTPATNAKTEKLSIVVINDAVHVSHSYDHPKDSEIRRRLINSNYSVTQNRGLSYTVTGCSTQSEVTQVKAELDMAYGLIEAVEDAALLSRIAIEIAIGASKTNDRRQRLTTENFPAGFNAVKSAQTDGFMSVCVETARNILKILK